jgi:transposase
MPRRPYPAEFRQQMVDLVRSGRSPYSLSKEFEPSAESIRSWVRQADLDEGRRSDGLTTEERDELRRLRRENRTLRMEREILKKQQPGSPGRPTQCRGRVRIREAESGRISSSKDVPRSGCLPQWVLRLA